MSTMYVQQIPDGETVNLRREPSLSSVVLVRVPFGAAVEATAYDGTWSRARYDGRSGYMMSKFLGASQPETDAPQDLADPTDGVIRGTGVRVRAAPGTDAAILAVVSTGYPLVYDAASDYTASGYRWLRCTGGAWSGVGYIAQNYVAPAGGGSAPGDDSRGEGDSSGESDSDGEGATFAFSAADAVAYAMNHSANSSGKCPKANAVFTDIDGHDDCASFVSQCLCAGGVPMFDGWFYRLSGIPAGWTDSKWAVTYSGFRRLSDRGWLSEVSCDAIQPGDIIYTYNASATPTPYTHVTIAVSGSEEQSGHSGCRVCGYTSNQHNCFKRLTPESCRCYRVHGTLKGNGSERRVILPLEGNGATVVTI